MKEAKLPLENNEQALK